MDYSMGKTHPYAPCLSQTAIKHVQLYLLDAMINLTLPQLGSSSASSMDSSPELRPTSSFVSGDLKPCEPPLKHQIRKFYLQISMTLCQEVEEHPSRYWWWSLIRCLGGGGGGTKCKGSMYCKVCIVIALYSNSSLSISLVLMVAQNPLSWNPGSSHSKAPVIIKSWYQVFNSTQGAIVGKDHNSLHAWTITLWNLK